MAADISDFCFALALASTSIGEASVHVALMSSRWGTLPMYLPIKEGGRRAFIDEGVAFSTHFLLKGLYF